MATCQSVWKSGVTCYALRLKPGEELYSSLLKYTNDNKLQAPFIMTCCGSLTKATLRLAGYSRDNPNNEIREFTGPLEIVSLVGTLSGDRGHLHISLSDAEGRVIGGHVIGGLYIFTTAEIVIGECPDLKFKRELDSSTGQPGELIPGTSAIFAFQWCREGMITSASATVWFTNPDNAAKPVPLDFFRSDVLSKALIH